ncbi:PQ-loop domain-containing transporter [Vagococcus fluvialis]|uniref:PQ-loop domain-containing transporter n=1 Tax=Vagococcus fluvialis TaxID=2738 RepID=UPI001D0B2D0B|nr:PQ-loop domain-containing transporter [Vagococcus fluvialis]UDM72688.1 hypothetical protein K5L00_14980 [Vagococcus fluvialis]UDM78411.1 hypothetical protein K5K98_14315 [Vagococcus fluvialis]UDM83963.1 hypothetical protein K5K96_15005 [Vagococcus fluvialis]
MEFLLLKVAPNVATILVFVMYLPQILLTYKTKDVKGQSLTFWTTLTVTLGCTVLYQIGTIVFLGAGISGFVSQLANTVFALIIAIMVIIYKNNNDKNDDNNAAA